MFISDTPATSAELASNILFICLDLRWTSCFFNFVALFLVLPVGELAMILRYEQYLIMGIENQKVESWTRFAQRGSSRVLVAGKPFVSDHSEKWMLSINA